MKGFEITYNGTKTTVAVKEGLLTIHINDVNGKAYLFTWEVLNMMSKDEMCGTVSSQLNHVIKLRLRWSKQTIYPNLRQKLRIRALNDLYRN